VESSNVIVKVLST